MSNVTLGPGGVPVDSLALVAVDGVTIIGDGAGVPLSAVSAGLAVASVSNSGDPVFIANNGFASVAELSTGVVKLILDNPPSDYTTIVPLATLNHIGASFTHLGGMIRVEVGTDSSIVVRTFAANGSAADDSFGISISIAPSAG
jgi:hypothetical protein